MRILCEGKSGKIISLAKHGNYVVKCSIQRSDVFIEIK